MTTGTATSWLSWRITGDETVAVDDTRALSCQNAARMQASRRNMIAGLEPGSLVTVIPVWRVSSFSSGNAEVSMGELIVEPVGSP